MNVFEYVYVFFMLKYMYIFSDLESGLSKTSVWTWKMVNLAWEGQTAGGGLWRYWRSHRSWCLEKGAIDQPLVSLRTAETEQVHQVKGMIGGIGNMLLSTLSQTQKKWVRFCRFFWRTLEHVITPRGQILVSRTDDDSLPSVCGFKKVTVCTGTTRTCFNTCARGAGIHGNVFNVHTEAFLNPNTGFSKFFQRAATHTHTHTPNTETHTKHTPRPPTQHHDHNDTHHTTQHTTSHGDRETERERET